MYVKIHVQQVTITSMVIHLDTITEINVCNAILPVLNVQGDQIVINVQNVLYPYIYIIMNVYQPVQMDISKQMKLLQIILFANNVIPVFFVKHAKLQMIIA